MTNEQSLRDYLLGRLAEAERESIEAQAIENEELYLTMRSMEDDLFDAFARGDLRGSDRDAFLQRYGNDRGRVAFAGALAKRTSNVVAFRGRSWIGWAAAAAIAIVAIGLGLTAHNSSLPATSTQIATSTASPVTSTASPVTSTASPATSTSSPAAASVILAVAIASSRSASPETDLVLHGDTSTVELRVRLNSEDRFERYALKLDSGGTIIWSASDLKARAEQGELIVASSIPARLFHEGSCELAVSGIDKTLPPEDLGFVTLHVRHTQ
jgi:hypothetical protein